MTIEHFCVDYVHKFYKFPPCRHIAEISFVSNVLLDFSNVINIQYNIQHPIISLSSSPLIMRSSTQLFWRRCFFILNSKWSYRNHLKRLKSSEGKLYNNLELLRGFFLSRSIALHCVIILRIKKVWNCRFLLFFAICLIFNMCVEQMRMGIIKLDRKSINMAQFSLFYCHYMPALMFWH